MRKIIKRIICICLASILCFNICFAPKKVEAIAIVDDVAISAGAVFFALLATCGVVTTNIDVDGDPLFNVSMKDMMEGYVYDSSSGEWVKNSDYHNTADELLQQFQDLADSEKSKYTSDVLLPLLSSYLGTSDGGNNNDDDNNNNNNNNDNNNRKNALLKALGLTVGGSAIGYEVCKELQKPVEDKEDNNVLVNAINEYLRPLVEYSGVDYATYRDYLVPIEAQYHISEYLKQGYKLVTSKTGNAFKAHVYHPGTSSYKTYAIVAPYGFYYSFNDRSLSIGYKRNKWAYWNSAIDCAGGIYRQNGDMFMKIYSMASPTSSISVKNFSLVPDSDDILSSGITGDNYYYSDYEICPLNMFFDGKAYYNSTIYSGDVIDFRKCSFDKHDYENANYQEVEIPYTYIDGKPVTNTDELGGIDIKINEDEVFEVPSNDRIKEFVSDYQTKVENGATDAELQKYINEFSQGQIHKENTNPNPSPGVDPGIGTNPDPGTAPGTETNPEPEPDNEDSFNLDGLLPNIDWSKKFPFCIPWDLAKAVEMWKAEPETPHWRIPFKMTQFGIDESINIDLSEFDDFARWVRFIVLWVFIVSLIVGTWKFIKR